MSHYYQVQALWFENVIGIIIKPIKGYLSNTCIEKLHCLSRLFNEMTTDVCRLWNLDFSKLSEPRIGYADQLNIQASHVNLATTGMIYYLLHPGMLLQYVKGEYVGESRDVSQIINDVLPYINKPTWCISSKSSPRAAPLSSTSRRLQIWSLLLSRNKIKQLLRCTWRSLQRRWIRKTGTVICFPSNSIRSAKQDDNYGASNVVLPCPCS